MAGVLHRLQIDADAVVTATSCGIVGATGSHRLCTPLVSGAGTVAEATSVVVCTAGFIASG